MPRATAERLSISGADSGLISGFVISASGEVREIHDLGLESVLRQVSQETRRTTWLHFNLSNALARQTIRRYGLIPADATEVLCGHQVRKRAELCDSGAMLVVVSDLTFDSDSEPADVAPLRCHVTEHLLLTGRVRPLKSVDALRSALRGGLGVGSPIELLIWIIEHRTGSLRRLATDMAEQVNDLEDEILAGSIRAQREQLGGIRRLCAQIRSHFSPDRIAFRRLLQQPLPWVAEERRDALRAAIDNLSFLIEEAVETHERAKLLQEELAARLAENTGRSLYVLAILTAVFLPMMLITGIFGMNVGGLPGMHDPAAFYLVTLLICAAGGITLAAIFLRIGR